MARLARFRAAPRAVDEPRVHSRRGAPEGRLADGLQRLGVAVEHADDLRADLERACAATFGRGGRGAAATTRLRGLR